MKAAHVIAKWAPELEILHIRVIVANESDAPAVVIVTSNMMEVAVTLLEPQVMPADDLA